jgi:hypothetical protein
MAPKKPQARKAAKVKDLKPSAGSVKGGRVKWGEIVLKRG